MRRMLAYICDSYPKFHTFTSPSVHLQDVLWAGVILPSHRDRRRLPDDPAYAVHQLWPQIAPHGKDDVIMTSLLNVVYFPSDMMSSNVCHQEGGPLQEVPSNQYTL